MSKKARRSAGAALFSTETGTVFHHAEVLYALEWAAIAPGLGGWNVVLDDDRQSIRGQLLTLDVSVRCQELTPSFRQDLKPRLADVKRPGVFHGMKPVFHLHGVGLLA